MRVPGQFCLKIDKMAKKSAENAINWPKMAKKSPQRTAKTIDTTVPALQKINSDYKLFRSEDNSSVRTTNVPLKLKMFRSNSYMFLSKQFRRLKMFRFCDNSSEWYIPVIHSEGKILPNCSTTKKSNSSARSVQMFRGQPFRNMFVFHPNCGPPTPVWAVCFIGLLSGLTKLTHVFVRINEVRIKESFSVRFF